MLNTEPSALVELEKARAAFTETHGREIIEIINPTTKIHHLEKTYCGTDEDLKALKALAQTPGFQNAYPANYIYACGAEIIASRPKETLAGGSKVYKETLAEVFRRVTARGVTLDQCAIITTGSEPAPSTQD